MFHLNTIFFKTRKIKILMFAAFTPAPHHLLSQFSDSVIVQWNSYAVKMPGPTFAVGGETLSVRCEGKQDRILTATPDWLRAATLWQARGESGDRERISPTEVWPSWGAPMTPGGSRGSNGSESLNFLSQQRTYVPYRLVKIPGCLKLPYKQILKLNNLS